MLNMCLQKLYSNSQHNQYKNQYYYKPNNQMNMIDMQYLLYNSLMYIHNMSLLIHILYSCSYNENKLLCQLLRYCDKTHVNIEYNMLNYNILGNLINLCMVRIYYYHLHNKNYHIIGMNLMNCKLNILAQHQCMQLGLYQYQLSNSQPSEMYSQQSQYKLNIQQQQYCKQHITYQQSNSNHVYKQHILCHYNILHSLIYKVSTFNIEERLNYKNRQSHSWNNIFERNMCQYYHNQQQDINHYQ